MMAQGPQRREPRRFEPPPWERQQFERLERERQERERLARVAAEPVVRDPVPAPRGPSEGVDPAQVDTMLAVLKAEEPPAVQGAWKLGVVAAAFVGTVGLTLVVWGMVALARSLGGGPTGILGATIMSAMGGLFVGLAAWMGSRSLKQRGVR